MLRGKIYTQIWRINTKCIYTRNSSTKWIRCLVWCSWNQEWEDIWSCNGIYGDWK